MSDTIIDHEKDVKYKGESGLLNDVNCGDLFSLFICKVKQSIRIKQDPDIPGYENEKLGICVMYEKCENEVYGWMFAIFHLWDEMLNGT